MLKTILFFIIFLFNYSSYAQAVNNFVPFVSHTQDDKTLTREVFVYYKYNNINKKIAFSQVAYPFTDFKIKSTKPYKIEITNHTIYIYIYSPSIIEYKKNIITSDDKVSINGISMQKHNQALIDNEKILLDYWISY